MINAKLDKIEPTKHRDGSNKKHALKKQLDLLRQEFLENSKVISNLLGEYKIYQASYKSPYHHGYLKIHIMKTQILTSTLHLYVTISKHSLKTHQKHIKATEKYHLIDRL